MRCPSSALGGVGVIAQVRHLAAPSPLTPRRSTAGVREQDAQAACRLVLTRVAGACPVSRGQGCSLVRRERQLLIPVKFS